ncbi:MAG: V-type ATP synthase subunit I [Candidatus Aminicenantales bacterium]
MSVAPVLKVHVFVPSGRKERLLSALQESGLVHIEETRFEDAGLRFPQADVADLDRDLGRLNHALALFAEWDETSGLKRLLAPRPVLSMKTKDGVLASDFRGILGELESLEAERSAFQAEIRLLDRETEFLESLRGFPLPLDSLHGTRTTRLLTLAVPATEESRLETLSEERAFWFEIFARDKRNLQVLAICPSDEEAEIEEELKEIKAVPIPLETRLEKAGPGEGVADLVRKAQLERGKKFEESGLVEARMKALAVHRPALMSAHDLLLNEREKLLASRLLGETGSAVCLEGWIRAKDKERLAGLVAGVSDPAAAFFRVPLPEEDPPVFLDNFGPARPFEIITGLYGLPERGYGDPTVPLAPFFFVFVGLCVTDGGYGFLVAALSLLYLKFGHPGAGARQFAKLALYLGISNIIFGTFFGGWLGFPIKSLLLMDPLKDPIPFLALSLGLGFLQVWIGTLLSMIGGIRRGDYAEAIGVRGGWLLLLPGLVLYLLTKNPIAGIVALAGTAGIVLFTNKSRNPFARFFGGLYGLYGISGYMSDTLSYSRILALGLSTAVIGMVVNNLTVTAFQIPVAGWVLAPLIFVGGHLFNLGIGFLGGFVHSMRLQFVEYFNKFYKGGGRPFKPLRYESRYMDIVE